jgi:hypothetical protein
MSSWLHRHQDVGANEIFQRQNSVPSTQMRKRRSSVGAPTTDANVPKKRLQIHQKCLYERMLPGNAFVSAHITRLQHGFYETSALHEDSMDDVYFASVHFVFHPHDPRNHRFKGADIRVSVHGGGTPGEDENGRHKSPRSHPRILKHAPELIFGAVSPENLQWNFSLSSSLGVSQAPVSATLNPQGGLKGSYKVYHMMSIQGSIRSQPSPFGPEYDVEDSMAVWTLEENMLQRSGLPREFDFVLLIHKPEDVKNLYLTVDVDADIEAWCGSYPKWYTQLSRYMPTQDLMLDFNADIGQRFLPSQPGKGFNFASLPHSLEQYVTLPGTMYGTNDVKEEDSKTDTRKSFAHRMMNESRALEASPTSPQARQASTPPRSHPKATQSLGQASGTDRYKWATDDLNVRVVLEHQYPQHVPESRRYSNSPLSNLEPSRYPSIRRRKSRTGLKEYGAKQALQDMSQSSPSNGHVTPAGPTRLNGHETVD